MATDDSMSDDVFEDETLKAAPAQRSTPSPTGYRDYQPRIDTPYKAVQDEDMPIHKVFFNLFLDARKQGCYNYKSMKAFYFFAC